MTIRNINNSPQFDPNAYNSANNPGAANEVAQIKINGQQKKERLTRKDLIKMLSGLSEIAESIGAGSAEEIKKQMAEDIFQALKIVEERQKKKP